MSRFIKNNQAFMSLTFSQIGLIIATGILLSAVFSAVFLNDWHKNSELNNISSHFSTLIEGMDTCFFENKKTYYFPDKDYEYNAFISTEYITLIAKGNWDNIISNKIKIVKKPFICGAESNWSSGEEFHVFLNDTYDKFGNETHPIFKKDINSVKKMISNDFENMSYFYSTNPLEFDIYKPVEIEKIYIFYDNNDDKKWDKTNDEKQSFILIHQNEN
jgi:hypothetical protein